MKTKTILLTVLSVAPFVAQAATTQLERDAQELSKQNTIAQANLLINQENAYLNKLKALKSKAESAKEYDLAIKLRDEITISEARVGELTALTKGEKSILNVKFSRTVDGCWYMFSNGKIVCRDGGVGSKFTREGDTITAKEASGHPVVFTIVDSNTLIYGGTSYYREGFAPKEAKKIETTAETTDTPFGKRVKF